jgi:uncharacterized protein YbjT (DUF2867 family)
MIAVVVGASGLVGGLLLDELLAREEWTEIHLIQRRPLPREHAKLHTHLLPDFSQIPGVDLPERAHYFCCLGTTRKKAGSDEAFIKVDHDYTLAFALLAKKFHAETFQLISAVNADANSYFLYPKTKGQVELEIKALGLNRLTIFRPSFLEGERMDSRPGEEFMINLFGTLKKIIGEKSTKRFLTNARELAGHLQNLAQKRLLIDNNECWILGPESLSGENFLN